MMLLSDCHADTLFAIGVEKKQNTDITIEGMKKGGVTLQVLALWSGPKGNAGDVDAIISAELEALATLKEQGFRQLYSPAEAQEGVPGFMLSVEGGEVFQDGLHTVSHWYERGVRMAGITWNNENSLGHPAALGKGPGLTSYGLEVVKEMQRLGIAVDVSHLNEEGFFDIFSKTHKPPLASHSCCTALCSQFRNLTDEQIRLMIQNGGFIGVNFYPIFLSAEGVATLDTLIDHIDHICQLGGAEHVGFGSDFDGIEIHPEGLHRPEDFPGLFSRLKARGYTSEAIANIAGNNLTAYYQRIG